MVALLVAPTQRVETGVKAWCLKGWCRKINSRAIPKSIC